MDPWADNPNEDRARPTPQRRKRGAFRLVRLEKNGPSAAIDVTAQPIMAALASGVITERQYDAAVRFEQLARQIRGPVGQRSCLDLEPVGHDESDGAEEAEREWGAIRKELGFAVFQAVDAVAYHHDRIERVRLVRQGLDWLGDYWGLAAR